MALSHLLRNRTKLFSELNPLKSCVSLRFFSKKSSKDELEPKKTIIPLEATFNFDTITAETYESTADKLIKMFPNTVFGIWYLRPITLQSKNPLFHIKFTKTLPLPVTPLSDNPPGELTSFMLLYGYHSFHPLSVLVPDKVKDKIYVLSEEFNLVPADYSEDKDVEKLPCQLGHVERQYSYDLLMEAYDTLFSGKGCGSTTPAVAVSRIIGFVCYSSRVVDFKFTIQYVLANQTEQESVPMYLVDLISEWGRISKKIHAGVVSFNINGRMRGLDELRKIYTLLNSTRDSRCLPPPPTVPGYATKKKGTGRKGYQTEVEPEMKSEVVKYGFICGNEDAINMEAVDCHAPEDLQ